MSGSGLHPAEHRGHRELYASAQALVRHWSALSERLGGEAGAPLAAGAVTARELLAELAERTAAYGLFGRPAARGLGARLGGATSGVADRFLERNQALRVAVLEATHVVVLTAYLEGLAERRGDTALAGFCRTWRERMEGVELEARAAAVASASDPDTAIAPAEDSAVGRAGHAVADGFGTLGEWIDRKAAHRR